ncbi:MAG: hypothetical protein IJ689_02580 [Alphaproteobacteria bacterium]|nr:hypothetical protein [Alphaproteobacteria bacterium]
MTNKTFLILLLAGVSYTAYNATAVSENFEISTTIDHEIVLGNLRTASTDANITKTGDINLGTIVISDDASGGTDWGYDENGNYHWDYGNPYIVSADNASPGYFTADIPNPEACNTASNSCGGLWVGGLDMFHPGWCGFKIKYTGNSNVFKVFCYDCAIDISKAIIGKHEETITISYNAS